MQDNTRFVWIAPKDASGLSRGQIIRVRGLLFGAWSDDFAIPGVIADQIEEVSQTLIVFAAVDTYVGQWGPSEDIPRDDRIKVISQENANARGFLKFDLSNVEMPQNARVLGAQLAMYASYNSKKMVVHAREISDDNWDENIGWLTMPVGTTPDLVTIDATASVKYVIDGDTVAVDNATIRLAGVNTPEYGEDGWLGALRHTSSRCPVGSTIGLNIDNGQGKTYDRIVAVLYYKDASGDWVSLNDELLRLGLAHPWLFPPTEFESGSALLDSCEVGAYGSYYFDVTGAFLQNIENDKVLSIMLRADEESRDNTQRASFFWSSDYINEQQRPHLEITYLA
jgi:hypothetical protein